MAEDRKGEVEIIPPGEESESSSRIWIGSGSGQGYSHVKIVKLGPLGTALALGVVALITVLGFAFLSGLFLLLLPVALAVGAWAYLTGSFKRLR